MKRTMILLVASIAVSLTSYAGDCVIKIKRDACPGKEVEAYKPYNGKVETEEKKSVADADACKSEAEKASKIVRKGTLTQKRTVASFDGKDLGADFTGKADCK